MSPELEAALREMGVREPLPLPAQTDRVIPPHHPDLAAWIKRPTSTVPF